MKRDNGRCKRRGNRVKEVGRSWKESLRLFIILFIFFFQAEDGIRDSPVTGVQTCALPISLSMAGDNPKRLFLRQKRQTGT